MPIGDRFVRNRSNDDVPAADVDADVSRRCSRTDCCDFTFELITR
jgi:hypothetical protein